VTATPSVTEGRFRGEPAISLRAGDVSATFLPDLGMTGVSLRLGNREHVAVPRGLAALRRGSTAGVPLLAPWANRLSCRRYRAAGVDVDLTGMDLHADRNGLPMHGVLVGKAGWRIGRCSTRAGRASVRAHLDLDSPAFPFPHRIELHVAVHDRRLAIDTTIVPTSHRAVPVAFGWHPYLRVPDVPRRHWRLRLPARTHLLLDERGIPDGTEAREPAEHDAIGRRTFDDLYVLGRDRTIAVETDQGSIVLHARTGYPCAQVWVPAGRPFVALEPMTAPTNSLVDGTPLLVESGDAHTATFTLTVGDGT
jgi:galactose mutarotase-like enzyme